MLGGGSYSVLEKRPAAHHEERHAAVTRSLAEARVAASHAGDDLDLEVFPLGNGRSGAVDDHLIEGMGVGGIRKHDRDVVDFGGLVLASAEGVQRQRCCYDR